MDLLNENRSLIYTGKLLRQPDNGLEWNGWSELFVLLFDNYSKSFFFVFILLAYLNLLSGYDQAQGTGWYYQIPRQSTSTFFLLKTGDDSHILSVAYTPRSTSCRILE